MTTYEEAGVNVELGNTCSEIFYNACKQTWKNRDGRVGQVWHQHDDFSGVRYMNLSGGRVPEGAVMGANSDGVGTKVQIAQRLNKHNTIAYDLVAMLADDAVRDGAEPMWMTNILDVNSLEGNVEQIRQLATGLVAAAHEAGVAVVNGEIAELGTQIGGFGDFKYNWNGTMNWTAIYNTLRDGSKIEPGQYIIALQEKGFRSNGFSLIRKIMEDNFGPEWHQEQEKLAHQILEPSTIYSKIVSYLINTHGSSIIPGIAHITGGGIPEKLGRLLKRTGYGAALGDLFDPCDAMKKLQKLGDVTDGEAYRTFNMGQGMLLITNAKWASDILNHIHNDSSIEAKIAGEITEKPEIIITNKGIHNPGKSLVF